ncbi:MAG: DUF2520 domain-containing protein [Bacteroidaceae bacterium]|nr:DUF2520 domain-containing protein [Bacteroidaceae bacterium]
MKLQEEKIVLIGAGNMATQLALALSSAGCRILQVYSRSVSSAKLLAQRIGDTILYTNNVCDIVPHADVYIFSLSDNALPDIVAQMQANEALWVHTAGSMPMEIFATKCKRYGVLYPMQTVNKERVIEWSDVPIFIEASNEDDTQYLEALSQRLSKNVKRSSSQQRQSLHLAAVFACNFANHMYAIAEKLLYEQGLDFDVMKYLIRETEHKAESISPIDGQTGPAVRNDVNVMNKHLAILGDTPEGELYRLISKNIMQYKPKQ